VQGRVDLGATVAADGKNHVEAVAPVEIKVSRQIMLKKDASNLATYTTCIKQTYWEPGCLKIEGVPDQENGRSGWAQIWFTNNRYDCRQVAVVSQPVGGALPPEVENNTGVRSAPLPQPANSTVLPNLEAPIPGLPTLGDTPIEMPAPVTDYPWLPEGPSQPTGGGLSLLTPPDNPYWLPWLPIKPPPGKGTPGSPPSSGGGGSPPPPPNSGSPPHGGGSPPPGGGGFPFGGGGFPGCHPGGTTPISAAPEPATWVQMIFGVALMGGLLRRNKQAPAP
jgi:hypothetical protein